MVHPDANFMYKTTSAIRENLVFVIQNYMLKIDHLLQENLFSRDEYWIERDNVELGELIGSGAFGEVHSGTYHHPTQGTVKVAIKMLRETANWLDRKLFLEEATIMK